MMADNDNPTTRTGRNLNRVMHEIPKASPNIKQAFVLPQTCGTCGNTLVWLQGSRVCACDNGHTYSYPNLEPLGSW